MSATQLPLTVDDLWSGRLATMAAARARRSLRKAQIRTVADLVQWTAQDLSVLFLFGPRQLAEVREALGRYRLTLAGESSVAPGDPVVAAELARDLSEVFPGAYVHAAVAHLVQLGWRKNGDPSCP